MATAAARLDANGEHKSVDGFSIVILPPGEVQVAAAGVAERRNCVGPGLTLWHGLG